MEYITHPGKLEGAYMPPWEARRSLYATLGMVGWSISRIYASQGVFVGR